MSSSAGNQSATTFLHIDAVQKPVEDLCTSRVNNASVEFRRSTTQLPLMKILLSMTWSPTCSTACLETTNTALEMDALSEYCVVDINNLSIRRPNRNETRERRNKLYHRPMLHFLRAWTRYNKRNHLVDTVSFSAETDDFPSYLIALFLNTCSAIDHKHQPSNRNDDQSDISEWEKLKNLLQKELRSVLQINRNK